MKNKKYLALTMFFEIMFLFFVMGMNYYYLLPSMETAQNAIAEMQKTMNELPETEITQLEQHLSSNSEFMSAYNELLGYVFQFIISVFALYVLFKTFAWHYTFKMIHPKIPFTTTLIKLPLLMLFWTIISIIIFVIFALIDNQYTILPKILFALILLMIFYYSQTSYSLIPAQKTFRKTFKTNVIKTFAINALILAIATAIPLLTIKMPLITMLIVLIITVPAIIFTRLNLIIASWEAS